MPVKRKRALNARDVAASYAAAKRGRTVRRTVRLPRSELKFIDFELNNGTVASPQGTLVSNGTTNNFCLIPEGDGPTTRSGRNVMIKEIHARWIIARNNATTPVPADFFRLVFLVDTQCNGADPSPQAANTGVFQNMAADPTDAQAFFNLFNGKRFKILYDKMWATGHTGAGLAATDTFSGRGFRGKFSKIWKKGLEITYDQQATTGTTATIRTNNVLAIMFSNSTNLHTIALNTRIRFTDS